MRAKKYTEILMAVLLLVVVYVCSAKAGMLASGSDNEISFVVVIDAGHGGKDPGKVSKNGVYEKDINLNIANSLKDMLESQGVTVIMTRENDEGLYEETDSNKKMSDMIKRCEIINSCDADLVVSIHQNSYPSESVKGAQAFYYETSESGRSAAGYIQESMIEILDKENGRKAKSNSGYYILLNSQSPAVIVECGFMSNPVEVALLCDKDYQRKIAWSIHMGIMKYINGEKLM
ncbi:MAG: N-acetylmuramoyl-L-alanine amidase CwlD [Lachnospiraceae bacterium]|nr:N-acetylmuramoyl-L-alanine amidase CwlD [Lachnospiraceae bacterium]